MTKSIIENFGFFHLVPNSTCSKQVTQLLSYISKEQLQAIGELFINIMYGIIPITTLLKDKLTRYKKIIEYLSNKRNSSKQRKLFLIKRKKSVIKILKLIYPLIKEIYKKWGK